MACRLSGRQRFIQRFLRRQCLPRPRRHLPALQQCQRQQSSSATYYDSQSGMHVQIHNESDIYVYRHWSNAIHLYKDAYAAFEATDELNDLSQQYAGIFLAAPLQFPRDERNLDTLHNIAPQSADFKLFTPAATRKEKGGGEHAVALCHYASTSIDELRGYKRSGLQTAIGLSALKDHQPWEVANEVATLIDQSGAGDYIWVGPSLDQDDDDVVQLCEELSYLDVPGPTMKSRLIIDCPKGQDNRNLVEEFMMLGVNKFVVYEHEQLEDCIQPVAEEQGKKLVKTL